MTENAGRDLTGLAPSEPGPYDQHPESYGSRPPRPDADPASPDPYGTDGYGADGYGADGYGTDGYGATPYGPNSYGRSGRGGGPAYGADSYGSDSYPAQPYPSPFGQDSFEADPYPASAFTGGRSAPDQAFPDLSQSGGFPTTSPGYPDPYSSDPYTGQGGDGSAAEPLEFPPFPEQAAAPTPPAPPTPPRPPATGQPGQPASGQPAQPAAAARPNAAPPSNSGVRLSSDAEATARLRIKLPADKPQPSTSLRPHASWEDREADQSALPEGVPRPKLGINEAAEFARHRASPARTTFLPSELAALTTATLVVPLPPDARPTSALVTTTLPPNMAAQANAALLADAFQDTMEEIFGIDFDAVSRAEVGLAAAEDPRRAARQAASGWVAESFGAPAGVRRSGQVPGQAAGPGADRDADRYAEQYPQPGSEPFAGRAEPFPEPRYASGPAETGEVVALPALSPSPDFGGRYGVPTQQASFRARPAAHPAAQDPARHALALRYLGGIFHDSTGESAYLEATGAPGPARPGIGPGGQAANPGTGALAMFGADAPTEQFARIRPADPARRPAPAPTPSPHQDRQPQQVQQVQTRPRPAAAPPGPDRPQPSRPAPPAQPSRSAAAQSPSQSPAAARPPAAEEPAVPRPRRAHEAPRRAADSKSRRLRPAGRNRALTVLALLVAAFAALYGIALIMAGGVLGGAVPEGTTVGGVSIGGLSPAAARAALTAALGPVAARPLQIRVGGSAETVDPAASGLSFDADATVAEAGHGRTDPFTVIPALFGFGTRIDPVAAVDSAALTKSLTALAGSYDVPMVEGEITFTAGRPVVVAPAPGRSFSVPAAYSLVTAAYLHGSAPIVVPEQDLEPKATPAALQDALENMAKPAVAGPVTVIAGSVRTVLSPTQIGDATVIAPDATGDLVAEVDGTKLRTDLSPQALAQEQPATDASFAVQDGSPVLVPGHDGVGFAPAALAGALSPVLTSPLPRSVTLQAGDLPPAFTTADAQALGVSDVLGTYTRRVTAPAGDSNATAAALDANAERAAELIQGAVVQPGATFSYLQRIGAPSTADGFTVPSSAQKLGVDPSGGVDLVATALFNAAFSSGMGDTVHHPNASYQDGNPVGLDAAVVYSSTDLQWTNTAAHPVYVYAHDDDGDLTIALLGEKSYDQVDIQVSDRKSVVSASTNRGGYSCVAIPAEPGFQVDVTRTLLRDGNQVGSEQFHVMYAPHNGVSCATAGPATPGQTGTGSAPTRASSPTPGPGATSGTGSTGGSGGSSAPPAPTPSPTPPSGALGGLFH